MLTISGPFHKGNSGPNMAQDKLWRRGTDIIVDTVAWLTLNNVFIQAQSLFYIRTVSCHVTLHYI